MKLARLLSMRPAELMVRSRQELSKWTERTFRAPRASSSALPRLTPLAAQRFFPGALEDLSPRAITERIPEARYRVLDSAQTLLDGQFDLLGYRGLDFGTPLDWHRDPVSGVSAPLTHWSRIDPLDASVVGDSKVIWEFNRHQWLVRLAQAYRFTGEGRYAAAVACALDQWFDANPRGRGINWASSLEVAFRLIAWCWTLHLLRGAGELTDGLRTRVFHSLRAHAAHVERYLSYYFSPNTHLTGEALGLLYASVVLEGLPEALRWGRTGRAILEQECLRQILPDGTYFEQSTCYQRYTAEIYLHYLLLARARGLEVPSEVRERITRLLDVLLTLCRPDQRMPQIGDADGGWLLPLDVRAPDDARGIFSTAAVLFRRPDYAWAAGGLGAETVWLLGAAAFDVFDGLQPAPPAGEPSRVLPDGGYVVLRSDWSREADQVIFDVGPLGCPFSSGHGHADLLSVQCTLRGRPYLVDPGTFKYTGDPADRRAHFRSSAAHSTVEVDGIGQATPEGPFSWRGRPGACLVGWRHDDALDVAVGEHRAYEERPGAVVHRRKVVLVKGGFCAVVDDLIGSGEHRLDVRFQLAPTPVAMDRDGWVTAGEADGARLFVRAFSTSPIDAAVFEGSDDPHRGWVSGDYGRLTPAPMLSYTLSGGLPARIITLLLPSEALAAPPPVSAIVDDGTLTGVRLAHRHEALYVDGELARLERA
jgi:hypothetical protein